MGFRNNAYATVWEIDRVSDTFVKARISIDKKNKETGEYETDFGGWVQFSGSAACNAAAKLQARDRIKLGDVDVTNKYDKERAKTYTNFKIWSFELQDGSPKPSNDEPQRTVDDGEVDDKMPLPF